MRYRVAAAALVAAITAADAQEVPGLAPALTAEITVSALDGRPLEAPEPGVPIRIDVRLESAVGADTPRGLDLFAWLRPGGGDGTSCSEAARAYFAAERNLPTNAIPLSGSVLAVLTETSAINLADPNFQLASANIVDAETLADPVTRIVADPFLRRVLALSADSGSVFALNASGGSATVLAEGLAGLTAIFPTVSGAIWVHAKGGVGPSGGDLRPALGSAASASGRHIAGWTEADAFVADPVTGETLQFAIPGVVAARPVETGEAALIGLAALTHDGFYIAWADAPDVVTPVDLPPGFSRLDVDPSGRFAVLHAPDVNDVAVIDIARAEVAQVILSNPPVSEVAFTSQDLFLLARDHSRVASIELASIRSGAPPQVRESGLGTPNSGADIQPGRLVPLPFEDSMIAVHPSTFTAFRLHGSAPTGRAPAMLSGASRGELPPMFAVTLRGGVPRQTVAVDRSFREIAPGHFRTVVTLPDAGGYDLVGTTGIGGMSFCSTLSHGDPSLAQQEGRMALVPDGDGWRIRFSDEDDRPVPFEGRLVLVGLQSGWRGAIELSVDTSGLTREVLKLPDRGTLAIVAETDGLRSFTPISKVLNR